MARVWTPIPETVVASVRRLFSGSLIDVLWKISVSILFLVLIAVLVLTGGFFGAFIASAILAALLVQEIRGIVSDIWHRNFWIWRT